jgi:hypothetical protein
MPWLFSLKTNSGLTIDNLNEPEFEDRMLELIKIGETVRVEARFVIVEVSVTPQVSAAA